MSNYYKKYLKYKSKYLIKKGGAVNIDLHPNIFWNESILNPDIFFENLKILTDDIISELEKIKRCISNIQTKLPKDYFKPKYMTIFKDYNIVIPLLSNNTNTPFIGINISTPTSIIESFIYQNLSLSNCNYLELILYVYNNKIVKIIIINQETFKSIIIFDTTCKPIYNKLKSLYEGIKKCFDSNTPITMCYTTYKLELTQDSTNEKLKIHSSHTVFINIYKKEDDITINYYSYIDGSNTRPLINLFTVLFKTTPKYIICCNLQGKINDLTKEQKLECLTKPVLDKLLKIPVDDESFELKHIIYILNNKCEYSQDIIDKILSNINGSCATIAFIYRCFWLINIHIPSDIRSDIISQYLDSLDICDLIYLILYYQLFIYNFINTYTKDLQDIQQLDKFIKPTYEYDLYKCPISVGQVLPNMFKN